MGRLAVVGLARTSCAPTRPWPPFVRGAKAARGQAPSEWYGRSHAWARDHFACSFGRSIRSAPGKANAGSKSDCGAPRVTY